MSDNGLVTPAPHGGSAATASRREEWLLHELLKTPAMSVVMVLDEHKPGWTTATIVKNPDGTHTMDVDFDQLRGLSAGTRLDSRVSSTPHPVVSNTQEEGNG